MFDTGFFCIACNDLTNFSLEFLGAWMALIDGQDVQGSKGLTLVPPGTLRPLLRLFLRLFEVEKCLMWKVCVMYSLH